MKVNLSKFKQSRLYLIIVLLTFIIYGNSINNEYSLDDNIVVDGIEKVNKGLKAIPEIFTTHHAIDKKQAYGYRPMVALTFALEKQIFKGLPEFQTKKEKKRKDKLTQANVSHFINVLIYAFTAIVLLNFLQLLFREYNGLLPLIITLLFLVHPLHTEPVANIKSRDELLMLLGMLLALIQYLKYSHNSKIKHLFFGGLYVLMAILSKKSALAMVGVVPVVLYFAKTDWKKILTCLASVMVFAAMMIAMKKGLVTGASTRNIKFFENPLLYQGDIVDRILMGFYCSWFYLQQLIFPIDMSFYYGYSHIPMVNTSHYQVWLGVLIYIPLGIYGFLRFLKRDVLGLGIVLWFGVMLGVNNVLFPIVGIVAERFAYVFSLGFCIVIGYLLLKLFKVNMTNESIQIKLPQSFVVVLSIIVIAYSGRVMARNPNWHDYLTTYKHDVEIVPNSAKANALIANTLYPRTVAQFRQGQVNQEVKDNIDLIFRHYHESIRIDSTYATSLNNLGSAYIEFKNDSRKGLELCLLAIKYDPKYVEAHVNIAAAYDRLGDKNNALIYYLESIKLAPENLSTHNSISSFLSRNNMIDKGIDGLNKLVAGVENPKYIYATIGNMYSLDDAKLNQSISYFEKAYQSDTTDIRLSDHLAKLYQKVGNIEKSNYYLQISSQLRVNNK